MTTIKLNKKSDNTEVKASKPPVRRTNTVVRDRSVALPKVNVPARDERPVERKTEGHESSAQAPARAGQRNHRFDGKLRESAQDNARQNARPTHTTRPTDKSEQEPKQARPAGADTRTTPRPDKNEPQYRQAPRRGGKVRDGYDAVATPQYGAAAKAAYKSTAISTDLPRLSKVMAERGICSRREADEWIMNSWVMVDGVIIDTLGSRINPDAEIVISSYAHEVQSELVTIILHKPVGYVSGQAEDDYQPAIVLVHPDNEWLDDPELNQHHAKEFQRRFLHGLAPAGRLDIDSTGMLVLTQDGRVARHLIGENSTVEKEYLVRVEGNLTEANMKLLNVGLSLDGEKLKPAKVSWQNEDQLRFVLREGKKRQIRRMCEMVGLHVVGLKRVRIGSVNLGKLPVGQWRYLRNDERF
ncbi:MAG: pseudouridine synthase [Methylotenera sp.]|nr:pseudouridine synthase [Methylotenera sp.]